ncbi:integrase [Arthrobacter phage Bridgette]|uniref:Integrase n=1 Tax=Arthrobacter phage Bridgette TaxID=2419949 RepID=A0A3G2KE83_9CAUD|nr:integrase [Arthrobacter phage Bridgette]AYN57304.1 integrase [Arthrobacter phage Bridgette]
MASIRTRVKANGSESHTVNWRDPEQGLKSRTFDDKAKAQELKDFLDANGNSFKLAVKAKTRKDSTSPTVAEVVEAHINLLRKPQPGTVNKYRSYLANHIAPSDLGRTPVDQVDREAVIMWMDGLVAMSRANQPTGQPLSRKSKTNIHALVSDAFKTAVAAKKMEDNPARGLAEANTDEAEEDMVYLSEGDLQLLEREISEEYKLFIRTLGLTGMRYAEATAVRKRDVRVTDDGRCIIRITRAWKDGGKGVGEVVGPPKSKKAVRNIPCSMSLSKALAAHMETLARDELLFRRPSGEYLRNSWFHKEHWQPLMKRLLAEEKLERKPRIHDIRAAHTTHLLEKNIPVHEVQDRLGHEDPQTTLKIYARLGKNSGMAAADAFD